MQYIHIWSGRERGEIRAGVQCRGKYRKFCRSGGESPGFCRNRNNSNRVGRRYGGRLAGERVGAHCEMDHGSSAALADDEGVEGVEGNAMEVGEGVDRIVLPSCR